MTAHVPAPAVPEDKSAQQKRITKKIRAAVDALVQGDAKSITEAAEKAGLSRFVPRTRQASHYRAPG